MTTDQQAMILIAAARVRAKQQALPHVGTRQFGKALRELRQAEQDCLRAVLQVYDQAQTALEVPQFQRKRGQRAVFKQG